MKDRTIFSVMVQYENETYTPNNSHIVFIDDADMDIYDVMQVFRGLALSLGFHADTVNEVMLIEEGG